MKRLILFVMFMTTLSRADAQIKSLYSALNGAVKTAQSLEQVVYLDPSIGERLDVTSGQTTETFLSYEAPNYSWYWDRKQVERVAGSVLAELVEQRNRASGHARDVAASNVTTFCYAMQRLQPKGYSTIYYGNPPQYQGEYLALDSYTGPVEIKAEVRFNPPRIYVGANNMSTTNQFSGAKNAAHTFIFYKK